MSELVLHDAWDCPGRPHLAKPSQGSARAGMPRWLDSAVIRPLIEPMSATEASDKGMLIVVMALLSFADSTPRA
jgi:hypothetical protein